LTVLQNDKRAIFSAAADAQKAVDFLHGFQTQGENGLYGGNRASASLIG
jgi:antirestriction protein ArdC